MKKSLSKKILKKLYIVLAVVFIVATISTIYALNMNAAPITAGNYVVDYNIQSSWGTGATVNVKITNNGPAIQKWTIGCTFPGNQQITNIWNATQTQSGSSVTVKNASWNGTIPTNGSQSFGFNLSFSGTNSAPTSFTVNSATSTIIPTTSSVVVTTTANTTTVAPTTVIPTTVPVSTSPSPSNTTANKLCALTFDDGPDNVLTPLVLDKLQKHNVKATFFMIGQKINDSTKATVQKVVNMGCEIGNHSWAYDGMTGMSADAIKKSVNDTSSAIQTYAGQTPKFFRPPNLSVNSTMYSAIDLPFVSGITANDWSTSTTAQQRADAIINSIRDGAIILLHDVQPTPHPTPEALDIIIPDLKSKGYEFVTLSELFRRKGVTPSTTTEVMYTYVQ